MDQTREHLERQPKPSSGISGDLQRLKTDASSTAEEVREFIATLKGRTPQEVLGAVSESGLVQATFQAAIACTVLLVVLTVLPWALASNEPASTAASAESSSKDAVANSAAPAASSTEAAPTTATAGTRTAADTPTSSDAARAASAMKIDETVVTDPKKNPLDGNLDKLLDGLD